MPAEVHQSNDAVTGSIPVGSTKFHDAKLVGP